jgi:hypothetical protein
VPMFFECVPADSTLFMDHPSMCFGLSNERRLFSGFAYFPKQRKINATVFTDINMCQSFSAQESLENLRLGNSTFLDGIRDDRLDEAEEGLSADNSLASEDWKEWGTRRPGFKALGRMMPLPRPGVYNVAQSNSSLPMPLVWTVQVCFSLWPLNDSTLVLMVTLIPWPLYSSTRSTVRFDCFLYVVPP